MAYITCTMQHLVKTEDLNHHGTLYAGRASEWFVEAGFIAAAQHLRPEMVYCRNVHGMTFQHPVHLGEIASFTSKAVLAGRTSLVCFIVMKVQDAEIVRGFITFINVDAEGQSQPHGLTITAETPEDVALQDEARNLHKR